VRLNRFELCSAELRPQPTASISIFAHDGETMNHRKPKLVLYHSRAVRTAVPATSEEDFDVYATYYANGGGQFNAKLKVVRKTDGRLLYPFEGASHIGPHQTGKLAIDAALALAQKIILADLANPEA
jgi:hypothetical protein